jgi:hypothetical protein
MTVNVKQLLRFYYYIDMEDGTETTNIDEDKLVELLQVIVDKLELSLGEDETLPKALKTAKQSSSH